MEYPRQPLIQPRLDVLGIERNFGITAGIANVVVLQRNPRRSGATFVNISDTRVFLCKGDIAVLNSGIPLNANGGSYEINFTNLYQGILSVITSAANKTLCVTEQE